MAAYRPVAAHDLTTAANGELQVGATGGYVPTVKAIRQVKLHQLPDAKPSSLYYEFILHQGVTAGAVAGDTWADLTASALQYIADRLARAKNDPVCDPALDEPYRPAPDGDQLAAARSAFGRCAHDAAQAGLRAAAARPLGCGAACSASTASRATTRSSRCLLAAGRTAARSARAWWRTRSSVAPRRGASVPGDRDLSSLTPHLDELAAFVAELEQRGFQRVGDVSWRGPRPTQLDGIADGDHMTITFREGWPYRPPQVKVPGIESWHADRDNLCLAHAGNRGAAIDAPTPLSVLRLDRHRARRPTPCRDVRYCNLCRQPFEGFKS